MDENCTFQAVLDEHAVRLNRIHDQAGHPDLPDAFWADLLACEDAIRKAVSERNASRLNQILNTVERGLMLTLAGISKVSVNSKKNGEEACRTDQQSQHSKKPTVRKQQSLWST